MKRSILSIKWAAVYYKYLWLKCKTDKVFVTEYPKSGGTWLSQLISDYYDIDFYRNVFPRDTPSVIHGHVDYKPYLNKSNVVLLVRDGRDVMVSFYYHYFFESDKNNHAKVRVNRRRFNFQDFHDIKGNLPRFVEELGENKSGFFGYSNWSDFNKNWLEYGTKANIVKYEDLWIDTYHSLINLFKSMKFNFSESDIDEEHLRNVIKNYDFKNLKKSDDGKQLNFLRKGIIGDWKNHFSKEAAVVFNYYYGRTLIDLGYVENDEWIEI